MIYSIIEVDIGGILAMNRITKIINNIAEDVIDTYDIHIPICNINDVVTTFGGYVYESADICNSDVMKQNDRFVIYIPSSYSTERKRFAVAQELGHLFLHMGYKISPKLWDNERNMVYYESRSPLEEYQANDFADALLMPKNVYKKVLEQYTTGGKVQTAKIAEYFGVSVSTAYSRGKSLGLLA